MKEDRFFQRATRLNVWLLPAVYSLFFILGLAAFVSKPITSNPLLLLGIGSAYGLGLFYYFDKLTQRFRKNLIHLNEQIEAFENTAAPVATAPQNIETHSTELIEALPCPTWVYSNEYQCLFKNAAANQWENEQQQNLNNLLDYQIHQNDKLVSFESIFNKSSKNGKAIKLGKKTELVRNTRRLFHIEGSCFSGKLPSTLGTNEGYYFALTAQTPVIQESDSMQVLNHLQEPILILKATMSGYAICYANQAACKTFQPDTNKKLIGQDFLSMHLNFGSQKDLSTLRKRLTQFQSHRCIIQIESPDAKMQEYEMTLSPASSQKKRMMVRFFIRQSGTSKVVEAYDTFSSSEKALMDTPLQIHQALKAAKSHGNFVSFLNIQVEKPIECLKVAPEQSEHSQTQIKQKLSKIRRQQDHLIDLGKDRFLLLIEGKDTRTLAEAASHRVAEAIIREFQKPIKIEKDKWRFKCFVGSSLYQEPLSSLPVVLKETRLAASKAYKANESHYFKFEPTQNAASDSAAINLEKISAAIEKDELALFLQPVLSAISLQCQHFEAWLRWEHPSEGLLEPKDFLPEVADTPEMWALDQWILKQALKMQSLFQSVSSAPISIAVKLSLQSFFQKDLSEQLTLLAQQEQASLQHLILQVEEHLLVAQATQMLEHLWALKSLGVQIHVTQAGTDILARNLIQADAVDAIELHPALMRIQSDQNSPWLLPFVQQYQGQGIKVIATDVESDSALAFAKTLGCDQVRGYLFCPPVKPEDAADFVFSGRANPTNTSENRPPQIEQ